MNIVLCQLDIIWENKKANYKKVEQLLGRETIPPGSLIVLPEMFSTGFSMNLPAVHEEAPSLTEQFLTEIARRYDSFVLAGLVSLSPDNKAQNQAVALDPQGRILTRYAKMQPFSMAGETDHYSAGNRISLFPLRNLQVAPFICYDLRFPELFRAANRHGAELFVVIANWPCMRTPHWVTLLQARAIENLSFVVGLNRCGRDPKFSYDGRSLIIDPQGNILADASGSECVVQCQLDTDHVRSWRDQFPALRDIRPEINYPPW